MDSDLGNSFTEETEYGSISGVAICFISPFVNAKSTSRTQHQGRWRHFHKERLQPGSQTVHSDPPCTMKISKVGYKSVFRSSWKDWHQQAQVPWKQLPEIEQESPQLGIWTWHDSPVCQACCLLPVPALVRFMIPSASHWHLCYQLSSLSSWGLTCQLDECVFSSSVYSVLLGRQTDKLFSLTDPSEVPIGFLYSRARNLVTLGLRGGGLPGEKPRRSPTLPPANWQK